jgi:hypothetical protein
VIGPAKGRWRCGMRFEREARTIEVTAEQLELLKADAELSVHVLTS